MATEIEALGEIDHAMFVGRILEMLDKYFVAEIRTHPFTQLLENVYFYQCLLMKPLLISNDFYGNQPTSLVINATHNLTKTSLSKNVNDLISV